MPSVYPLMFEPILKEKVWGGRRLARYGKTLPEGAMVGESWEIADLAATSASGAGGGAARSVVANRAMRGSTLAEVAGEWGRDLLGSVSMDSGFPLLVKYLDAREHLSVQVHPSPAYAEAHAGAHLKTECWYIVEAEAGSVVYKGVKPGVTREAFEEALRAGSGEGVVELLEAVPARVGEMHNLPSGTVHALGAGVLVAEVQTPSDTTFRVYDWALEYGRAGRELHIEQALACIDFGAAPDATALAPDEHRARLVETEFFAVDVVDLAGGGEAVPERDHPLVVMVVEGDALVCGAEAPRGTTVLVPASCVGEITGAGRVLLARVGA